MILLLHDGELVEARALLNELRLSFIERNGHATEVDRRTAWDLIIASPARIRDIKSQDEAHKSLQIGIVDNDSKTLRSLLRRLGVDFVVALPVHIAALRLLVLHAIYRGPERRRQPRVSVGAPVQTRVGLFKREAVLEELSLRGCRLVLKSTIAGGKKIKLYISSDFGVGKAFSLTGRVLRATSSARGSNGEQSVAVAFEDITPAIGPRLRRTYEKFLSGPAQLSGGKTPVPTDGDSGRVGERRTAARYEYSQRIVALDDEATRVLLCRDISIGGMRVAPNDSLVPGDDLLIAIHSGARSEPLVVNARVIRDDRQAGLVLTFHDLSDDSARYLKKMVDHLPTAHEDGEVTDEHESVVVSEIVERRAS